jgi:bla regulator protein BlaR1
VRLLDLVAGTPVSEALGWTLVHSLWEGTVIAAALAAVLILVRSPRTRYAAGCFALLAALASFAITLLHFLPANARTLHAPLRALPAPWRVLATIDRARAFPDLATLIPWFTPLWLAGVCLFYLRHTAGWVASFRLRCRGVCHAPDSWQRYIEHLGLELKISRPVVLLESLLADSPLVIGHLRPVILVPLGLLAHLPPDHIEAILLHELTHISRSDYLMNVCQRLVEGLLFYHPAVWWISRVVRTERENCCDDAVIASRGDAYGYAVALTSLAQKRLEQQWPAQQVAVAATGGNLVKRIKRLLYSERPLQSLGACSGRHHFHGECHCRCRSLAYAFRSAGYGRARQQPNGNSPAKMARPGRGVYHLRRRESRLRRFEDGRGTPAFRRTILVTSRSHAWHTRERI